MLGAIGIDSRKFVRKNIKIDGTQGNFESVLGIAVKTLDYELFDKNYQEAIKSAFLINGEEIKYRYYCFNDFRNIQNKWVILNSFLEKMHPYIDKVHVFYTLFSVKRVPKIKVYGRIAKREKIKLDEGTRTYKQLISEHLINCFPGICAWRLTNYLYPDKTQFHLDSYNGHTFEAQEEFEESGFTKFIYPGGDCVNPLISTADLLLALLDNRLEEKRLPLIFENIRPALPEFQEKLLAYPILNRHLPKITPLEKKPINNIPFLKHPVYWVFKGDELINAGEMKRSNTYREFLDYVAIRGGCIKLFSKNDDAKYLRHGDFGVYINPMGLEIIKSYNRFGKKLSTFNMDLMVSDEDRKI